MPTIMPEGEAVRKAVKWISDQLQDDPNASLQKLINDADQRFNLAPKDAEYLMKFYQIKK